MMELNGLIARKNYQVLLEKYMLIVKKMFGFVQIKVW